MLILSVIWLDLRYLLEVLDLDPGQIEKLLTDFRCIEHPTSPQVACIEEVLVFKLRICTIDIFDEVVLTESLYLFLQLFDRCRIVEFVKDADLNCGSKEVPADN